MLQVYAMYLRNKKSPVKKKKKSNNLQINKQATFV